MNCEALISKVKLNPPIWDRRIKEHTNRTIVDACWRKISTELKIDEASLRKKWKYLRDQFSVEYSKTQTLTSETVAESKWLHFKKMLFLKDIVTPRTPSSSWKQKMALFTNNNVASEQDTSLSADEKIYDVYLSEEERETSNEFAGQPRKRRHVIETDSLYSEKILQLEQQKINTIQKAFQREPENDDIMFFRSLLPFVSKIPTEKKLSFRSRIQQVVEEFAFMEKPLLS